MSEKGESRGLASFLTVWAGQLVSAVGSGLTSFALGVWVLEKTGSSFAFSVLAACTLLPSILLLPVAGALVDRWDRRRVMMMADVGAAACTIGSALLLLTGYFDLLPLAVLTVLASVAKAFRWPAYAASVTLLVPRRHLGRANGLMQLGEAAAEIIAPLSAGWLVIHIGLEGVILVDAASFIVGVGTLLAVRIPRPAKVVAAKVSIVAEVAYAWRYFRNRSGLFELLCFAFCTNFTLFGVVQIGITPLVLSFANAGVLGYVIAAGGLGAVAGSAVMSVWGGTRHRIPTILILTAVQAGFAAVAGLSPNAVLIGVCLFGILFCFPIIAASTNVIWQTKVSPEVQGRVFAIRRMISWSSIPVAYLCSGFLAEHVFNPMLLEGGALAGTLGRIVGVGPGRGIGVMFLAVALVTIVVVLIASLNRAFRGVEDPPVVGDLVALPATIASNKSA